MKSSKECELEPGVCVVLLWKLRMTVGSGAMFTNENERRAEKRNGPSFPLPFPGQS